MFESNNSASPQQPAAAQHRRDRSESIGEFVHETVEHFREHAEEAIEWIEEHVEEAYDKIVESEVLESFSPYGGLTMVPDHDDDEEGATEEETMEEELLPAGVRHHHYLETDQKPLQEIARVIGTLQLAVIVFYSVSGGPFGIEEAVRSGGNFFTLLGLIVLPLFWSVPESLVTAELGASFPEAAGSVVWVEEAFGNMAGWIAGYSTWISGVTDNAIYPALFLHYLVQVLPTSTTLDTMDAFWRFILLSSLAIALGYVNYTGLPVVGELSITICIISMSPFLLFCLFAIPKLDPSLWFRMPESNITMDDEDDGVSLLPAFTFAGVLWRPFLNNMFWNLNSFDSAASFAGEVLEPGRVFPKAMFWSLLFVVLGYLVPMLFILGSSEAPQHAWVDGYLATAAYRVVGPWLGAWTVFASGISNVALFQAEMSSDAFLLMGMSDRGYVPKMLGMRSKYGTPTICIGIGTLIIVVLSVTDMSSLIEMLNFNYSICLIMEYASFIKLRISRPDIERPYRIPLNTLGCVLLLTPPVLLTTTVMLMASRTTLIFGISTTIFGVIFYVVRNRRSHEDRKGDLAGVELESEIQDEQTQLLR